MNLFRLALIIGTLPNTLTNGTVADATQVMADFNKIVNDVNSNAAPLSNTALLNANNNFTDVQSGIGAQVGANFPIASQVQNWSFNTLTSTLGTNTLTSRIAGFGLSAYAVGQVFTFIPSQANSGSVTMSIDGLGSAVIKSSAQQLVGGELGSSAAMLRVSALGPMPVLDLLSQNTLLGQHVTTLTYDGGGGISAAITLSWEKRGRYVTLNVPAAMATSGTGSVFLTSDTALPPVIRPAVTQVQPTNTICINNAGTADAGVCGVLTTGFVRIARNNLNTAWTNSTANSGSNAPFSITYFLG